MTRRMLFQILAAPGPYGAQRFGQANPPQCPLCHTQVPLDMPAYQPVIVNSADGTTASLTNVRQCFCAVCGVAFVVSAK